MSLDMNTHGREIRQAIESVTSDASEDWVIIGYENKNTLFVAGQGDGGLEEMVDEFHGSKIMYGYVRVKEPNTGLPKFVFINWQGEGAPERMKFACSSHSSEVQRLCRPVHVTVNARDDSDLDPSEITGRVVKASGSQFSVLKSSDNSMPDQRPVISEKPKGSVYKKVNPTADILNKERDAYWQKLEREEAQQKAEEIKMKRASRDREERERKAREEREALEREKRTAERARQIAAQRSQEEKTAAATRAPVSYNEDPEVEERERRSRSESLKNERQAELASLVAARNAAGLAPSQKISSSYQKVDPRAELASLQRDQYWTKLEQEEKQRKERELQQSAQEKSEMERARRQREEEDAKRREVLERERAQAIAKQRQAENQSAAEADRKRIEAMARAQHREATEDEEERHSRSERLRRERQEEAARLIGQRGGASAMKARFQGGSTAPSYQNPPQPAQPAQPAPPPQPEPEPEAIYNPATRTLPNVPPEDVPASAPMAAPTSPNAFSATTEPSSGWTAANESTVETNDGYTPQESYTDSGMQGYDQGSCAEAIYDYAAAEEDEISFNPGDIITHIEQVDDGWWMGQTSDGHHGLFPSNYVRLI